MKRILVTGSAGFIGFHLSKLLLADGFEVIGYDGMTDYYDVRLKERRHQTLLQNPNFKCETGLLEDFEKLTSLCDRHRPDIIIHLAGQAGVRYSLENPRAYIDSNVVGTFNIMECARELEVEHLLMSVPDGEELIVLRVWADNIQDRNDRWRATLTRHVRDTDLYLFHHWGYQSTQADKTPLTAALPAPRFIFFRLPDGTVRITQKRK